MNIHSLIFTYRHKHTTYGETPLAKGCKTFQWCCIVPLLFPYSRGISRFYKMTITRTYTFLHNAPQRLQKKNYRLSFQNHLYALRRKPTTNEYNSWMVRKSFGANFDKN